jgi:hypothetical protein
MSIVKVRALVQATSYTTELESGLDFRHFHSTEFWLSSNSYHSAPSYLS